MTIFDTEFGPMALVLVGATIVASIETVWAGTVTPPAGKDVFSWQYPATGLNSVTLGKRRRRVLLQARFYCYFGFPT
ncbi:Phosphatidylserine decarboxylase proenzyme [Alishewanella longhuensis]